MYFFDDTIVAAATPIGAGAITIIRLSGKDCIAICDKLIRLNSGKLIDKKGYTISFGVFLDGENIVDEVLVSLFRNPHSYTGEDSIEISCHASKYIADKIIQLFCENGCRIADHGEFTQRAFINGKMDLAQAESVADLIASKSRVAHDIAIKQLRGGFSEELHQLRGKLLDLCSLLELELDFSEEDVEFADRHKLLDVANKIIKHLVKLESSFKLGNAIKNGIGVAIVGPANAGKSTFLNAILNEDRAIVSDIEGTTRDTIEESINLNGNTYRFIDTAGIRKSKDKIENIGIERSFQTIENANIVLVIIDITKVDNSDIIKMIINHYNSQNQDLIIALNKKDLLSDSEAQSKVDILTNILNNYSLSDYNLICTSFDKKLGIEDVKQGLYRYTEKRMIDENQTLVTNIRHYRAIGQARTSLMNMCSGIESGLPTDLIAEELRDALTHLGSITGEITNDEVLGNIFSKFCIGK